MKKLLLAMSCGLLFFSSCKKDSISKKQLYLTTGKWQMTAATANNPMGGGPIDLSQTVMQPCVLDNTYAFNSNGKTVQDEGATKCNTTDAQSTELGDWKLMTNDTQLQIPGIITPGVAITANITQLDDNVMVLNAPITYSGITLSVNITMAHIK